MKAPGNTSPQAAAQLVGHDDGPDVGGPWRERSSRLYRIRELIGRYQPRELAGAWRVWDREAHRYLDVSYADETHARAGAYGAAACDIDALYDERPGR